MKFEIFLNVTEFSLNAKILKFQMFSNTGNLPSKRTRFSGSQGQIAEFRKFYRLCAVSRTNNCKHGLEI